MKRNPKRQYIEDRLKSIKVKKFRPLLFFTRCCCCGYEYKYEPMFECGFDDVCIGRYRNYIYGCTNCFSSTNDFRSYLEKNDKLYTEKTLNELFEATYE